MMFRVTNLANAMHVIHNAKLVAVRIGSNTTMHIDLSKEAAISIQRFSKTLRIEPVDEAAAAALGIVFTPLGPEQLSMRFNDPVPPPEETIPEPPPPALPQEEWAKLDEGTATILKDLAQKAVVDIGTNAENLDRVLTPDEGTAKPRTQVRLSKAS